MKTRRSAYMGDNAMRAGLPTTEHTNTRTLVGNRKKRITYYRSLNWVNVASGFDLVTANIGMHFVALSSSGKKD